MNANYKGAPVYKFASLLPDKKDFCIVLKMPTEENRKLISIDSVMSFSVEA